MFNEVFGMATSCIEGFQAEVCDAFGASIVDEVLDPILKEIDSLRIFNADFHDQLLSIDNILTEARCLHIKNIRWMQ